MAFPPIPNPIVPPGTVPWGGETGAILAKLDGSDPVDSYQWSDPATVPAFMALDARLTALENAVAALTAQQQPTTMPAPPDPARWPARFGAED
jgi:hypothetical protein